MTKGSCSTTVTRQTPPGRRNAVHGIGEAAVMAVATTTVQMTVHRKGDDRTMFVAVPKRPRPDGFEGSRAFNRTSEVVHGALRRSDVAYKVQTTEMIGFLKDFRLAGP